MKIEKDVEGITLVMLTITIIVLLMLGGIVCVIANGLLLDRASLASVETTKAIRDEESEFNWVKNYKIIEEGEYDPSEEDKEDKDLLKERVKIGDYIEYPIEYGDVYTEEYYTASNGWRVIDDGISGSVKIISTGVPVKFFYNSGDTSLLTNFEELDELRNYQKEYMRASDFKVEGLASKVTTLSLADLNHLYNRLHEGNRADNEISPLEKYSELICSSHKNVYFWLATNDVNDSTKLYYVNGGSIESMSNLRLGIRMVIELNEDLTGRIEDGIWKIMR